MLAKCLSDGERLPHTGPLIARGLAFNIYGPDRTLTRQGMKRRPAAAHPDSRRVMYASLTNNSLLSTILYRVPALPSVRKMKLQSLAVVTPAAIITPLTESIHSE
ncbi:MAG: hypothetical protein GPOALKHO_001887 [Sodalis sp.]|nr:MAG: hypothetical protein GPOALKHO_001887 [Sodalis sp.]